MELSQNIPACQAEGKKEFFRVLLFLSSFSSQVVLFQASTYDTQQLQPANRHKRNTVDVVHEEI